MLEQMEVSNNALYIIEVIICILIGSTIPVANMIFNNLQEFLHSANTRHIHIHETKE